VAPPMLLRAYYAWGVGGRLPPGLKGGS